ncbi:MAG TPA: prepilin-type N-terminal cleavage/methylation domain-containing protein [Nitrospirota bacterium]
MGHGARGRGPRFGVKGQGSRVKDQQKDVIRGFTLIELTIVIVVLGIMLALIIPRLGELGEANLKRSSRHLTGMMRFLRDDAAAKKKVYRLRFDVTEGRYWAEELIRLGEKVGEFKRASSEIATEGTLSGQTTFRDVKVASHPDEPVIQFTPDGWVESAMIHLRDGDNRDFTLRVKPLTGDTELLEGYIEER